MCLVPNATEQTTDRSRRGTLLILLLVAAVGVGLWFALERPKLADPSSTAKPATGDTQTTVAGAPSAADDAQATGTGTPSTDADAQTADSGAASTADDAQTTVAGAASTADDAQTTVAGAASTADDAQTTVAGAASTADDAQTTVAGAASTADDAQTTVAGAASTADDTQTADSGAASTADDAQTTVAGAASTADDAQTADSGAASTADDAQTTVAGAASTADDAQTADSGAASTADDARTTVAGAASTADDAQTADSGAASTADDARTTVAGAASAADDAQTADSGAASTADDAQTTVAGAASTAGDLQTTGAGTAASQEPTQPVDPDATGDATRVAAVEPGTASVDETPRISPAPESRIEKTPVDAPPPDDETTGEAGVLAAVGRAIEQIETAIKEGLDTGLEVQVTYDDSQGDVPQAEDAPTEPTRAAESDPTLPAGDAQAPDSDVDAGTSIAGSTGSGGATSADATRTTESDTALAAGGVQVPDSDVGAGTSAAGSSGSGSAAPSETTAATATSSADAQAKEYVETLTGTAPQTIPVDKADHFVTPERVISLVPEDTIENVSVDELASDETLSPDTPITVVREVEQVEDAVAEQLIADSGGDLDKELRVQVTYDDAQEEAGTGVVDEDDVQRITVREALERIRTEPDKPLPVIKTVRYFQVVTLKELLDGAAGEDAFLNVVTRPYRIESATLADLLERQQAENPDSIFYLHTVLPTDEQGIWGIVHFGIIDNFARGMAIRQGKDIETYTVRIPRHADERLADRSSSFLGLLIDRKTKESYVYNFRDDRMGRNPDRIFPGQELVIINFQTEELMAIYKHFAAS